MRSRFVAFSLGARAVNWGDVMGEVKCNTSPTGSQAEIRNAFTDYLVQTHHPDFREPNLAKSLSATFGDITWQSLQVCAATSAGDTAQVEFIATYTTAGRQAQLQERSSFVRESGRWLYTTGEMDPAQNGLIE